MEKFLLPAGFAPLGEARARTPGRGDPAVDPGVAGNARRKGVKHAQTPQNRAAAETLVRELGAGAALVKGGHIDTGDALVDVKWGWILGLTAAALVVIEDLLRAGDGGAEVHLLHARVVR